MNKRKNVIRSLAEKTGLSHAGAANLLDKNKPGIARKAFTIESLFVKDHITEAPGANPGVFVRTNRQVYMKDPDETVYVIGEEGDAILSLRKPREVSIPLVEYRADRFDASGNFLGVNQAAIDQALCDRMVVMLETALLCAYDTEMTTLELGQVEEHFQKQFVGKQGVTHILPVDHRSYQLRSPIEPGVTFEPGGAFDGAFAHVVGVLDYAGIMVTEAASDRIGLGVFGSRVKGVKVRRPPKAV